MRRNCKWAALAFLCGVGLTTDEEIGVLGIKMVTVTDLKFKKMAFPLKLF